MSAIRLINTRPQEQASELSQLCLALGFDVWELPFTQIQFIPFTKTNIPGLVEGIFLSSWAGLQSFYNNRKYFQPKIEIYTSSRKVLTELNKNNENVVFATNGPDWKTFLQEYQVFQSLNTNKSNLAQKVWVHFSSAETQLDPQEFLRHHIVLHQVVAYQNMPETQNIQKVFEENAESQYLVFCAGSSVKAFSSIYLTLPKLKQEEFRNRSMSFALGATAKQELDQLHLPHLMAPYPNLESLGRTVQNFFSGLK